MDVIRCVINKNQFENVLSRSFDPWILLVLNIWQHALCLQCLTNCSPIREETHGHQRVCNEAGDHINNFPYLKWPDLPASPDSGHRNCHYLIHSSYTIQPSGCIILSLLLMNCKHNTLFFSRAATLETLIRKWYIDLLSMHRKYFSRNLPALSSVCRVYALDLRFHGDSESTLHGHHVARLAADFNDFLTCLNLEQVVAVGTSLVRCWTLNFVHIVEVKMIRVFWSWDFGNRILDPHLGSGCRIMLHSMVGPSHTLKEEQGQHAPSFWSPWQQKEG